MPKQKDALDEMVAERSKSNPAFPQLLKAAAERRKLARQLAKHREERGLTQTVVAARMGTSAAVVSRLESGADFQFSTLEKYILAIGATLRIALHSRRTAGS